MVGKKKNVIRLQYGLNSLLVVLTLAAVIGAVAHHRRFAPTLSVSYGGTQGLMTCTLQYSESQWEKYSVLPPYTAADIQTVALYQEGQSVDYSGNDPVRVLGPNVRARFDEIRELAGLKRGVRSGYGVHSGLPVPVALTQYNAIGTTPAVIVRRVPGEHRRYFVSVRKDAGYVRTFLVEAEQTSQIQLKSVTDFANGRRSVFAYDRWRVFKELHYQISPQMERSLQVTVEYLAKKSVFDIFSVEDVVEVPIDAPTASNLIEAREEC